MTTLHLGVLDVPYKDAARKTTGDVAEILEAKYHIMENFWELHHDEIVKALAESITGAFESLIMGAPVSADPNAAGSQEVVAMFQKFLSSKEMDTLGYPGIPTAAAQRGVSHRFKKPYAKRAPRPSFIDTGLLESSFQAWVDNQ